MNEDIRVRIGARIRELREEKGLSIRDLSELTGINHSNICSIENGRYNIRLDSLEKFEKAFDLKIDFIKI